MRIVEKEREEKRREEKCRMLMVRMGERGKEEDGGVD